MTEAEAIEAMIENEYAKGEEIEAKVRERVDKELPEILDKISAEIKEELRDAVSGSERLGMYSALRIIEKYKGESEEV